MLNELYDAAASLEDSNIKTPIWHDDYGTVPVGKPTFFVFIDTNGHISRVEPATDSEGIAGLRKWETGNGYSFPYFNIPPLWWMDFDPKKQDKPFKQALDKGKLTSDQLNQFIQEKTVTARLWEEKHLERIGDCLGKIACQLKSILGDPPDEYRSIAELIRRAGQSSATGFYEKLQAAFREAMLTAPSSATSYFKGAFHYGDNEPKNNISILLELADMSIFPYPVKHLDVGAWINDRLLHPLSQPDAFGNDLAGSEGRLPNVNVSVLGPVKLRAMNHEARCQYRYGEINEGSFPVGRASRDTIKGALEWLTAPEREGKTWATVSRASASNDPKKKNQEILLAYPSELPPDPPDTAMFFGGSAGVDTDNTGRFENCAQNVTGALRGLMAKNPNLDIRVFLLRKMDTARTRVSSHKRCSAQHLIQAAEKWQVGSRNLPLALVKQFTKDKKTAWGEPQTPFPMETVWALNTLWVRGGEKNGREKQPTWSPSRTKSLSTADGLALLLEDGTFHRPVLDRILYAATRNLMGLVLALGQAHAQGQVFATQKNYARQALIMPSVLGLLLYKLNITKEHYMKSAPYLVGRLLSLADQLHHHYCQHVRDGSVPPQLMGNALMATALEEPVKALALYCNRILPYQAWARTVSGDAVSLAHYFLSELGKVSSELGDVSSEAPSKAIPERCTDADKAQMLIGYLARPEKSDSSNS